MKNLDILVLANRHESTHIYLEYLHHYGYKVQHLLEIRIKPQPKPSDNIIRYKFIGYYRKCKTFYQYLSKYFFHKKMASILQEPFSIHPDHFTKINFAKYANNIDTIEIRNMNDLKLLHYLQEHPTKTLFYAASGMISQAILDIPQLKVIHIHPGKLPYIRGTDGLFWSLLIRKKIGMSCFYMDSGIDTGSVIQTKEYEPILPKSCLSQEDDIYEAILKYYEPHFRAKLLIEVLQQNEENLHNIESIPQAKESGGEFFSMHKRLRDQVIQKYFFVKEPTC